MTNLNNYLLRYPLKLTDSELDDPSLEWKTFQEIWDYFNLTKQRVEQIVKKMLLEIKEYIRKNNLEDLKDFLY